MGKKHGPDSPTSPSSEGIDIGDAASGIEIEQVDLRKEKDYSLFRKVSFAERASLEIARWILLIFGIVYVFSFCLGLYMFRFADATFDNGLELVKFLLSSILPLATLSVGYYLGDRNRSHDCE